jgi:D-tyrosyl-tRNA(Tyr) deacylase
MRLVIQRVSDARVVIDGDVVGAIGCGQAILLGVREGDTDADAATLASKAWNLRIFEDTAGKMNLSAAEAGAEFLVVSQFTLYANTSRGRRPSFIEAAGPELGERLYERFVAGLRAAGAHVETGRFGAQMKLELTNDGPVTIILDSEGRG